jgi:hypothetical protein
MSNISPQGEQSTSSEIRELTALNNLAIGGSGTAIQKTGQFTFANVSVGSSSATLAQENGTAASKTQTFQNSPLFIVADGQTLVSGDGYSVVGSGPYIVTFDNAPVGIPHSFHN